MRSATSRSMIWCVMLAGAGMGIGAYQAKETMRDLGGDIEVSSKVGRGTTITLLLPSATTQQRRISA